MAMFDRLAARIEQRARERVEQTLQLAEAALSDLRGAGSQREGNDLVISGRGLMRRWLSDARLRFALWRSR